MSCVNSHHGSDTELRLQPPCVLSNSHNHHTKEALSHLRDEETEVKSLTLKRRVVGGGPRVPPTVL